jgi:hypothetical protein
MDLLFWNFRGFDRMSDDKIFGFVGGAFWGSWLLFSSAFFDSIDGGDFNSRVFYFGVNQLLVGVCVLTLHKVSKRLNKSGHR